MISAGNDIVSLTATNVTRTKSPEFYSKIISPAEKILFGTLDHDALPFDRFVWLLWSVKESAYKFLNRLDPTVVFTPVKFEVQSIKIPPGYSCSSCGIDEITGCGFSEQATFNAVVVFGDKRLFSKTFIHNEFVSSAVNHTECFDGIYWGVKQIDDAAYKFQSAAVRAFALVKLREVLGVDNISIDKNENGVPVLLNNPTPMDIPVSFSHHGRWIAFSFQTLLQQEVN